MKVVYDADGLRIESQTEFEQTYIRMLHARGPLTGYLVNGRFLAILPDVPAPTPAVEAQGECEDTPIVDACPVCDKPIYEGVNVDPNTVVHRDCVDAWREAVKP